MNSPRVRRDIGGTIVVRYLGIILGVLLFTFSVFAGDSGPLIVQVKTDADPKTGLSYEGKAGEFENAEEAAELVALAEKEVARDRAQNAHRNPEIIVTQSDDPTVAPGSIDVDALAQKIAGKQSVKRITLPKQVVAQAKQAFKAWYEKHERGTLTFLRGTANGSTIFSALIFSKHLPVFAALPTALAVGGMSAGYMYYSDLYERYVKGGKSQSWFLSEVNQWVRSYTTQIVFLTIAQFVSMTSGIADGFSYDTMSTLLSTAALGTFAQGSWNLFIFDDKNEKLERLGLALAKQRDISLPTDLSKSELQEKLIKIATEFAPREARKIKSQALLRMFFNSAVSTLITVGKNLHVPNMEAALLAIGATGALMRIKTWVKMRDWAKLRSAKVNECNRKLAPEQTTSM